jgi:glycosyltransferase involved in cell wall biosynthesis
VETITYLLANYNNENYLRDCLNSLLEQTDKHWLALICDDASNDHSIKIINLYLNDQITLIRNEQNQGYTRTLKRLIEMATTDIVGILDPDDLLHPEATKAILDVYNQQPTAAFVYTRFQYVTQSLHNGGFCPRTGTTSLGNGFIGALRTFRRQLYYRTEGLDEMILYAEDRDLVYKLEEMTEPVFIDRVLYQHRMVPTSQSHGKKNHEIGLRSHQIARKNALQRRKITGKEKQIYWLFFYLDYVTQTYRTSRLTKRLAHYMILFLDGLDRRFHLRSNGQLCREKVNGNHE